MISSIRFQGTSSKPPQAPLVYPEGQVSTGIQPSEPWPRVNNGKTAALRRLLTKSQKPNLSELKRLLAEKADPNAKIGKYPFLYYVTRTGLDPRIAEVLMRSGASTAPLPEDGTTLFHHLGAEMDGTDTHRKDALGKLATSFVKAGVPINALDKQWNRPLDVALEKRDPILLDVLLNHGAKTNYVNAKGLYPLRQLHVELTELRNNSLIHKLEGNTQAIAVAIQKGREINELVWRLNQAGARMSMEYSPQRAVVALYRYYIDSQRRKQEAAAQS